MKTIKQIRVANLNALIESCRTQSNLAELVDREPSVISQLVNGHAFGEKIARHFEQALGLAPGWMDHDHSQAGCDAGNPLGTDITIEERLLLQYVRSLPPSRRKIVFDLARDLSLDGAAKE